MGLTSDFCYSLGFSFSSPLYRQGRWGPEMWRPAYLCKSVNPGRPPQPAAWPGHHTLHRPEPQAPGWGRERNVRHEGQLEEETLVPPKAAPARVPTLGCPPAGGLPQAEEVL